MTPDKIFLAFEHGFVAQASTRKKDTNGNSIFLSEYNPVEYIRKDALLEWTESELESITGNFGLAEGGKIVLNMLIDKLDSI